MPCRNQSISRAVPRKMPRSTRPSSARDALRRRRARASIPTSRRTPASARCRDARAGARGRRPDAASCCRRGRRGASSGRRRAGRKGRCARTRDRRNGGDAAGAAARARRAGTRAARPSGCRTPPSTSRGAGRAAACRGRERLESGNSNASEDGERVASVMAHRSMFDGRSAHLQRAEPPKMIVSGRPSGTSNAPAYEPVVTICPARRPSPRRQEIGEPVERVQRMAVADGGRRASISRPPACDRDGHASSGPSSAAGQRRADEQPWLFTQSAIISGKVTAAGSS